MNWRAATIIFVTAIPIIIVAVILFKDFVDINDKSCKKGEVCVRYCCNDELKCDGESHDLKDFSISKNLETPYKILRNSKCPSNAYKGNTEKIIFLQNGIINEDGRLIPWKHYCVDIKDGEILFELCFVTSITDEISQTYPYFMLASLPFLLVTLLVYGCTRELRNLHGKCLMAYVFSLTIMYATLIVNGLNIEELYINYRITCITIGYVSLTSVLCCFFWLNVMCFDIYRTFRKGIRTTSSKEFIQYCAYAFGIPIVIVLAMFFLNFFRLIPDKFNNNIGNGSCSVSTNFEGENDLQMLNVIYIYGPIILLLAINIIFYGITACKIFHVENETAKIYSTSLSRIHSGQSDSSENRTRFLLYVRLSVVMGVPWIIEILSFSLGTALLFAVSIFNCMQGFVIFITFVWNPRVMKQLQLRYTRLSVIIKKQQPTRREQKNKNYEEEEAVL